MKMRAMAFATGFAAGIATLACAQQPAPPPPSFAAANLTEEGVRSMASACAMCHGTAGRVSSGSSVASLAGRPQAGLVDAMKEFRDGKRQATIMHQIAKGYSDAEIAALGAYFAKQQQ